MRENGIEPLGSLVEWGEPANLLQYNLLRGYKLHDVLARDPRLPGDPLGEVPIVAFSLGQAETGGAKSVRTPRRSRSRSSCSHIALRRTHEFAEAARLTGDWTRIGERTRPYTEFRFEEMMDQRVEDVRQQLLGAAQLGSAA